MRGCGHKMLLEAAGGVKAFMPIHLVLSAGVCYLHGFTSSPYCRYISMVVYVRKGLRYSNHSLSPLPDAAVA